MSSSRLASRSRRFRQRRRELAGSTQRFRAAGRDVEDRRLEQQLKADEEWERRQHDGARGCRAAAAHRRQPLPAAENERPEHEHQAAHGKHGEGTKIRDEVIVPQTPEAITRQCPGETSQDAPDSQ